MRSLMLYKISFIFVGRYIPVDWVRTYNAKTHKMSKYQNLKPYKIDESQRHCISHM